MERGREEAAPPRLRGGWDLRDHRKSNYARKRKGEARGSGKSTGTKTAPKGGARGILAGEGKATRVQGAGILKGGGNTVQSLPEVVLKPPAACGWS